MELITRLILVRHGETLANRDFRYIGSRDDALSEVGVMQARQLGEGLKSFPVNAIYSSPLQRAYHTAESIALQHGMDIQVLEGLAEGRFGDWEGMSRAEVLAQDEKGLLAWEHDPKIAAPGGESFMAVRERVLAAIQQIVEDHPAQTVVVVSHVGPIKILLCSALDAPLSSMARIFLNPATISVIDWKKAPVVRLMNSHAHLGWEQPRWLNYV